MSITHPTIRILTWQSVDQTQAAGRRLGAAATPGQVIALQGDLGAGKTTLTQGIAAGLGIAARVTSPTFILTNEYDPGQRGLRFVHIDAYRLGEEAAAAQAEAATFGLEEILATAAEADVESRGAVVVIEWAERVAGLLPADHLRIVLTPVEDDPAARQAEFTAFGPQSAALLAHAAT